MPTKDPVTARKKQQRNRGVQKTSPLGPKARERAYRVLEYYASNPDISMEEACNNFGATKRAYEMWRHRDPDFRRDSSLLVAKRKNGFQSPPCPFTAEFRETYFMGDYVNLDGEAVHPNPKFQRDAIDYVNSIGRGQVGMILMPPGHGKTTLGEDWLCQGIADDPESRNLLISKTQDEAIKRLLKIQARMEDIDLYGDFIRDFGPFKPVGRGQRPWGSTKMTVLKKTPRQRDYSLQALGMKGTIQGVTMKRILLDDIADDENQSPDEIAKQLIWMRQSLLPRLRGQGRALVLGTRQFETDLYSTLINEGIVIEPLILPAEFDDQSYLWPEMYTPEQYEEFKRQAGPATWALTWQQQDYATEGMAFPLLEIEACFDNFREVGHVPPGTHVVVGIDPAAHGFTAGVVIAYDPVSQMRYLVDVWNEKGLMGDGGDHLPGIVQFIVELCKTYNAKVCCIEKNAQQVLITENADLRRRLTALGVRRETFFSGREDDLAIMGLANLFTNRMISIPVKGKSKQRMAAFVSQFASWRPSNKKLIRDIVKATQFAEHVCRNHRGAGPAVASIDHLPPYLRNKLA